MTLTLFELAAEYKSLEALIDSEELPDELIRDTVEGLVGSFQDKAVNVAKVVLHLEHVAQDIKEAAKAMALRAERVGKRAERLKAYLLYSMQLVDQKKLETSEMVIRRQNNPPTVVITDEAAIPREYWYQPPPPPLAISKKAVLKALQDGQRIEGAFQEQGEHLRIVL
jgi:hypothetical protein